MKNFTQKSVGTFSKSTSPVSILASLSPTPSAASPTSPVSKISSFSPTTSASTIYVRTPQTPTGSPTVFNAKITPLSQSSLEKTSQRFIFPPIIPEDNIEKSRPLSSPLIESTNNRSVFLGDSPKVIPSLDTAIIVSGASGFIAKEIIEEFRHDLNSSSCIIGLTRKNLTEEGHKEQELENKKTGKIYQQVGCDYTYESIRIILKDIVSKGYKKVVLVNTVGGANLEPGSSYEALNVTPVRTMCMALSKLKEQTNIDISIVHLSSHTTALLPDGLDPYINSRYAAQRIIEESGLDFSIIRLGIITSAPKIEEIDGIKTAYFDTKYDYSPERNATLPISFSLGAHDLPLQWTDARDVARAVYMLSYGGQINSYVNAVSSDMATQEDMNATLRSSMGEEYRPSHIPLSLASAFVNCDGGRGRFTPYATSWAAGQLAHQLLGSGLFMDYEPFEKILGRKAIGFEKVFEGSNKVKFPETNISGHTFELLRNCIDNPEIREQTINSIREHGIETIIMGSLAAAVGCFDAFWEPPKPTIGLNLRSPDERTEIIEARKKGSFRDQVKTINDKKVPDLILNFQKRKPINYGSGFRAILKAGTPPLSKTDERSSINKF